MHLGLGYPAAYPTQNREKYIFSYYDSSGRGAVIDLICFTQF